MSNGPADQKGQRIAAEQTGRSKTDDSGLGPAKPNMWVWLVGIVLLLAILVVIITYFA